MKILPARLFTDPAATTLLRVGNCCILHKQLIENTGRREGYLATHVVSVVLSGKQIIETYEGDTISVNAGQAIMIPRGLYHISDFITRSSRFESLLVYFDDQAIDDFFKNPRQHELSAVNSTPFIRLDATDQLISFANYTVSTYRQPSTNQSELLLLKTQELLHLLCQGEVRREVKRLLREMRVPRRRGIRSFMEQNYCKPLKVEDYAYLTGRSISTFRRDFKAYFQQTPQNWLREKRMEEARQLAESKNISVTQLAHEVGYENVSYFIRAFKSYTGRSPKQYMLNR